MARPFSLRGYAVERLLGCGASGDVWQARVVSSGARVALKRIAVRDDEQVQRAHEEAALLRALDHPNLIRLHAVVASESSVVLVLDLADGGSLADLLAARVRLTPGEAITCVAPVAAALAYLHGAGVVHGDVSAANVLFTAAGVPMLADVGVARLTGDDADAEATPAYVDPAVAAGCVPGPPSDVFMLGGVALHALTGAPPWPDPDADAALARATRAELGDVSGALAVAGVVPAMSAVVLRALAIDPQRRGTAADLALDLRHSGSPLAVELAAGRARAAGGQPGRCGPRHAAAPAGRSAAPVEDARPLTGTPHLSSSGVSRPAFARPTTLPGNSGGAPPTRMVVPRPRPIIPRTTRRRSDRRRALVWATAALAGALLVLAGALWFRARGSAAPTATPQSRPAVQVETIVADDGASATPPADDPAAPAVDWQARLAALDGARAKAFATRDAGLLREVYVSGPLLRADTALLARIVPAGCGLVGAHTRYASVRAAASASGTVLTATATLAASRLMCGGHRSASAPAAGPVRLRLVLTHTADGLRITDERSA